LLASDVTGDDAEELLLVSRGVLFAKTSDDTTLWQTDPLELLRIAAVTDLNQDGSSEIIATSRDIVYVIAAMTGQVLWALPRGTVGSLGAIRLADFNGDSAPDIYLADAACGSLGSLGDVAEVWSFASDLQSPTRLFQLERKRRDYACGVPDVIADVTGDGQLDIVAFGNRFLYVYSGVDGSLISASESVGTIPYAGAFIEVGNVDADAGVELVCYANSAYDPASIPKRVFLMDWDPLNGRLVKRWERAPPTVENAQHFFGTGGLGDLDGDDASEVVTSFYDPTRAEWSTLVLDATTGTERTRIQGGPFRGLVDFDRDGALEVVTGDRRAGVTTYRWASGTLAPLFAVSRFEPLTTRIGDASAPTDAVNRLLTVDLDRINPSDLVGLSYAADGVTPEALVALSGQSGPLEESARLPLGGEASVLVASPGTVTRAYEQLVIARNDGFLWVLDESLAPTHTRGTGVRFGGYYSGLDGVGRAPLATDFDGDGASEVVAIDSRNVLQTLSAASASLTQGPSVGLQIPGARLAVLADVVGDSAREIVHWSTNAESALRAVRASDGARIWQRTIGTSTVAPVNDLMVGDTNGDSKIDIVYSMFSSSRTTLRINAARGDNGARQWPADFETPVSSGRGVGSLYDRNADGSTDVLAAANSYFHWIDGKTGVSSASANAGFAAYGLFDNLDADADLEIIGSGALSGVASYELDLSQRFSAPDTRHARINGAVAICGGGSRYLSAHNASARFTSWNTSTGAIAGEAYLRGGKRYVDLAAVPEGVGQLGHVTMSPNLTGDGKPAALVPSSDGFLYAVDPCSLALVWAVDLGAAVGEAILANTDRDGDDEIIVTAADGFLYGIDQQAIAAPRYVYENDGRGRVTDAALDLDRTVAKDTLHANWAEVADATSYEVAVLDEAGSFITSPDFLDVGQATEVAANGLMLKPGHRYLFAVRANGPQGRSADAMSDGVVVLPDPCDQCGPGTTCLQQQCVVAEGNGGATDGGGKGNCVGCADRDAGAPPGGLDTCTACGAGTRCVANQCVAETTPRDAGAAPSFRAGGGGCALAAGRDAGRAAIAPIGLALATRRRRNRRRERSCRNSPPVNGPALRGNSWRTTVATSRG